MDFRYDAFFSYRHKPLDADITQRTFNLVESYRLPKTLRDRGFEEVQRAFRDTEELPVSRVLTATIDQALRSTKCLIVVCSTDTPSSEWIDREVATFIELDRADHIYPLLITGDPEHSFPPSLKLVPDIIDRVMDIRTPDNNVRKMMAKAEIEVLRAIADMAGCTEAELLREHKMRKNRRFAARVGAGFAAFAAVAAISLGLMNLAQSYRNTAQKQEEASMRILNELTYSLPDHLTNVPGAYGRIAGILERNTEDINAILRLSTDQVSAEAEAAANYEKLANASAILGTYDKALSAQETAIASYEALVQQSAEGSGEQLASAYNNLGNLYTAAGRYDDAASAFEDAIRLQISSGEEGLQLARMYLNAGANAVNVGDEATATQYFDSCIALLPSPETADELENAAKVHQNYGVILYRQSKYQGAEEHLRSAVTMYESLLKLVDSLQNRAQTVQCMSALATVLTDEGNFAEAEQVYTRAISSAELLAQDQENTAYQRNLAELCNNRGIAFNMHGDYSSADAMYTRAAGIYGKIAGKTGAVSDRVMAALSLMNLGENAFKLPDYLRSKECFEEGLSLYESVLPNLSSYDRAQYLAWLSYYRLIHPRDYKGAFNAAYEAYQLQPNNVLVNMNLGYACLYNDYTDDAKALLGAVGALGGGQVEMMRRDLEAQQAAGMENGHIPELLKLLDELT
ncbi:MAG: tetratricopeptide repeat protein [Oscillospiraceae bacterium]|nr:tetratricopeptide repeat protein [Oscillospiraceae bacterium]